MATASIDANNLHYYAADATLSRKQAALPEAAPTRRRPPSMRRTFDDPSAPLRNPRHEAFAEAYSVSGNASEAYRHSTGRCCNADVHGGKWVRKAGIQSRVQHLRRVSAERATMGREEVLNWLCEVIRGTVSARPEQLRAVELLNRMCGWEKPVSSEESRQIVVRIVGA